MGVDTFICGNCGVSFHDIHMFLQHKNDCLNSTTLVVSETKPQVDTDQEGTAQTIHMELVPRMPPTQPMPVHMEMNTDNIHVEEEQTVEMTDTSNTQEVELMPVVGTLLHGETPEGTSIQVIIQQQGEEEAQYETPVKPAVPTPSRTSTGTGRRRGRPRRGEERPRKVLVRKEEKKIVPEKSSDGRISCPKCRKSFNRERHFVTHRCLGYGDYVDITRKEALGSDEDQDETDDEDKEDKDKTIDFKSPLGSGRGRGRPRTRPLGSTPSRGRKSVVVVQDPVARIVPACQATKVEQHQTQSAALTDPSLVAQDQNVETAPGVTAVTAVPEVAGPAGPAGIEQPIQEASGENAPPGVDSTQSAKDLPPIITSCQQIKDLPVFDTEMDKVQFEDNINVDFSEVETMYKIHVIDQDINENAPPVESRSSNELSIYSCNICDKVFMTQSHMRLHCLTHTQLKPFKCNKCEYATNSKGNLYTHMRKHTGQFYRCSRCAFKTVNKGHLVEHEATHANVRQKCLLCHKDYNTVKSLVNHVRKYHCHTQEGADYLSTFLTKPGQNGVAVLHQCHVCNRKFKKKIDRDRHLFIHDIRDAPNVFVCDLCDYTASRRTYLENHFRKHRTVYVCCECSEKFPSTIRLNQHLAQVHQCSDMDDTWMELFHRCVDSSLFLPEPDGSFGEQDKIAESRDAGDNKTDQVSAANTGEVPVPGINEELSEIETSIQNIQHDETTENTEKPNEPETAEDGVKSKENDEDLAAIDAELDLLSTKDYNIYERLSYCQMNMEIFQKLRQTFGNEECQFCGRLFYSKSDFEPHLRTHTGDRPFACNQCDYRAITKDALKRHIEKEHDKVTYICNECDFVANSRTQLWHHQQKHKSAAVSCPKCNIKFVSGKRLRIHLMFKHPEMGADEIRKATSSSQKQQGKMGRRSHKCPYCDKTFLRGSADLQKHIWIHEGIKPFKCPICPHACRSKNNLATHMLRHSSEKPYLCTECGKAYKSKTALRWHVRTHRDGKIFKCTKCPYEAVQKSHLVRHMETHNVVKRFICEHCDYSANTLGYMKIHYTRSHKGMQYTHNPIIQKPMAPEAKVYRCLSCDYLFGNLSDMKRHLKIRHHLQVEDIRMLENVDGSQVTQIVSSELQAAEAPQSEVQVVEVGDEAPVASTSDEQDATAALQTLQYSVPPGSMDERTASAVNILQQIIDMQQQGAFTSQQQITVQSEDGQSMLVNPETIIVQQDGEEVVVSSSNPEDEQQAANQYVIQYVTPDGTTVEGMTSVDGTTIDGMVAATQPQELTALSGSEDVLTVGDDRNTVITDADTGQVLNIPVSMATQEGSLSNRTVNMIVTQHPDGTVSIDEQLPQDQMSPDQQQIIMQSQQQLQQQMQIDSQEQLDPLVQIVDDHTVIHGVDFQGEIQASEEIPGDMASSDEIQGIQIEEMGGSGQVEMVETALVSEEVEEGALQEDDTVQIQIVEHNDTIEVDEAGTLQMDAGIEQET